MPSVHQELEDFTLIDGLAGLFSEGFGDARNGSDLVLRQLLIELLLLHLAHHKLGEGGLRLRQRLVLALEPRLHRLSGRLVLPALVRLHHIRAVAVALIYARVLVVRLLLAEPCGGLTAMLALGSLGGLA